MARGRKPVRGHAARSMNLERIWAEPLADVEAAVRGWLRGEGLMPMEGAVARLIEALDGADVASETGHEFTRDDKLVIAARDYQQASRLAETLASLHHLAKQRRETALADVVAMSVVPPEIPVYGAKFVKSLLAVGAVQGDLHPATSAKAKAVLSALRDLPAGPNRAADDDRFEAPPIRDWSELPRRFAGYELVDTDERAYFFDDDPLPLPPMTDIAMYTDNGRHDVAGGAASPETLRKYAGAVTYWARDQGRKINGDTAWAWALLLAYRLEAADEPVEQALTKHSIIASPWDEGKAVKAAKL